MDLRTQVIPSLAHRLVKLRGTQESFTARRWPQLDDRPA